MTWRAGRSSLTVIASLSRSLVTPRWPLEVCPWDTDDTAVGCSARSLRPTGARATTERGSFAKVGPLAGASRTPRRLAGQA